MVKMVVDINKQIVFLKNYFEGLKKAVSEARKKGLDTRIAELRMMNIPHKIKYLEVSRSKGDVKKLKVLLARLEQEIPKP